MPFQTIQPNRLYLQVADQILESITAGEYPPGSQLPQERVLAERLGVSRATVREGLTALEVLGYIQTLQGQGSFVRQQELPLDLLKLAGPPIGDVIQVRSICEVGIVRTLAENPKANLTAVEDNLQKFRKAHEADHIDQFVELGMVFHNALAEATGNTLLARIVASLTSQQDQPLFRLANRQAMVSAPARFEQICQHQAIYQDIRAGRVDEATRRMHDHLLALQQIITRG